MSAHASSGLPTTAILCIARNELPFCEEWFEHHVGLGFDRIHLISTDDDFSEFSARLDSSRFRDRLRLYHFDAFEPGWQIRCYNQFFGAVTEDWVLIIDLDEYLLLHGRTIPEFIASLDGEVGQVQFPWVNVLPDGYFSERTLDLLDGHQYHASDHVKSMVRRADTHGLGVHSHGVAARTVLTSGCEVPARHGHAELLQNPDDFHQKHPCILHFCSRGHFDTLNRISDHRFFNSKNGERERERARRSLEGALTWADTPTRYLLLEFYRSLPRLELDIVIPRGRAATDVPCLEDLFKTHIRRIVDFDAPPSRSLAESFEALYHFDERVCALEASACFDIDDYLDCGSQVEYLGRLRRAMAQRVLPT